VYYFIFKLKVLNNWAGPKSRSPQRARLEQIFVSPFIFRTFSAQLGKARARHG